MIRKTRNLLIALGVMALLIISVILVNKMRKEPETQEPAPARVELIMLSEISPESLRNLSIENPEGSITLSSMDGFTWIIPDTPPEFQAKETLLRSLISNLSAIRGVLIDENPDDSTVYGLNNPSAEILLTGSSGNQVSILFGNSNLSENGRYARLKGESQVFLVPSSIANKAFWSLEDIREDRLPEINTEAVTFIYIRSGTGIFQAVPHSGELGPYQPMGASLDVIKPWKERRLIQDHIFQQTMALTPPPSRISGFLKEWVENPESLGLGPEDDRIIIEDTSGGRYNMEIGNSDGQGRRYARESGYGDVVFLIDEKDLGLLDIDPFAHTGNFVFLAGIDRVTEVKIDGPGVSHVLSIEKLGDPEDDSDDTFSIDGIETGEKNFKKIYQSIIGLMYEGAALNDSVEAEPEYSIRYTHVNPEISPKTIQFIPYDQTYYLAGVEGEDTEFIIGRYQVQLMLDKITGASEN